MDENNTVSISWTIIAGWTWVVSNPKKSTEHHWILDIDADIVFDIGYWMCNCCKLIYAYYQKIDNNINEWLYMSYAFKLYNNVYTVTCSWLSNY